MMTAMWNLFEAIEHRASKLDALLDMIGCGAEQAEPVSIEYTAEIAQDNLKQLMVYVAAIRNEVQKEVQKKEEKQ